MKYTSLLLIFVFVLLPIDSAFAGCPDYHCQVGPGPTPPQCNSGCYYSFDASCASTSNVSAANLSFCGWPGHQFSSGVGSVDYQMTVPTGHGNSCKDAAIFVDFYGTGNANDAIRATVYVYHNGSLSYWSTIMVHDGTQTELTCSRFDSSFSVADGDTIEVEFIGTNYYGSTIKVAPPIIFD